MEDNKTFTQEEVYTIVSKRLAEERTKFNQQLQQKESEYNARLKEYKEVMQREKVQTRLLNALNKHDVIEPGEMVKLVKDRVHIDDNTGESYYLTDTGERLTIEEGVTHWANKNTWAVKNNQKPGAGSGGVFVSGNSDPIRKAFKLDK